MTTLTNTDSYHNLPESLKVANKINSFKYKTKKHFLFNFCFPKNQDTVNHCELPFE